MKTDRIEGDAARRQTPEARDGEDEASQAVESLRDRLHRLVREREALRQCGSERDVLENNRRAIVNLQWELSYALINRYGTRPRGSFLEVLA